MCTSAILYPSFDKYYTMQTVGVYITRQNIYTNYDEKKLMESELA